MGRDNISNPGVVYSTPGTMTADGTITQIPVISAPVPKWQQDSLTMFGKRVELNSSSRANSRKLNLGSTFRCIVRLWMICLIIAMLVTIIVGTVSIVSPDSLPVWNSTAESNSTTSNKGNVSTIATTTTTTTTTTLAADSESDSTWYNNREVTIGALIFLTVLGHCVGFIGIYKLSIPWTSVCSIWIICFPLVGLKAGLHYYVLGTNVFAVFLGGTTLIWNLACYAKVKPIQ